MHLACKVVVGVVLRLHPVTPHPPHPPCPLCHPCIASHTLSKEDVQAPPLTHPHLHRSLPPPAHAPSPPPTPRFNSYARIVNERLVPRFNAVWHWAKLEAPDAHTQAGGEGAKELARIRARLAARYPLTLVGGGVGPPPPAAAVF